MLLCESEGLQQGQWRYIGKVIFVFKDSVFFNTIRDVITSFLDKRHIWGLQEWLGASELLLFMQTAGSLFLLSCLGSPPKIARAVGSPAHSSLPESLS